MADLARRATRWVGTCHTGMCMSNFMMIGWEMAEILHIEISRKHVSVTYDLDLWPKILKIFVSHGVPIRNMYAKFHNDRLGNGWDITLWNFAKTRTNTQTNRHGHYNTSPSPYGGRGNNKVLAKTHNACRFKTYHRDDKTPDSDIEPSDDISPPPKRTKYDIEVPEADHQPSPETNDVISSPIPDIATTKNDIPAVDSIDVKAVCEGWQREMCSRLKLNFVRGNGRRHVSDMRTLPTNKPLRTSRIKGDGNCLFRAFSKILTGNQDDHGLLRTMTVSYIMDNLTTMRQVSPNIAEHLHTSNMISLGTWGTEIEIFALATILNATVYVYSQLGNSQKWLPYGPYGPSAAKYCIPQLVYCLGLSTYRRSKWGYTISQGCNISRYTGVPVIGLPWPYHRCTIILACLQTKGYNLYF